MPEQLCQNPKALLTPRKLSPSKPCGFWESEGVGWCNKKDYLDWITAYKIRIDAAKTQFKDLEKLKVIKGLPLTSFDKEIETSIKLHSEDYKKFYSEAQGEMNLTSEQFSQKISDIIQRMNELVCTIESIQTIIEDFDGTPKATGLVYGTRGTGFLTYAAWGLGILAALKVISKI